MPFLREIRPEWAFTPRYTSIASWKASRVFFDSPRGSLDTLLTDHGRGCGSGQLLQGWARRLDWRDCDSLGLPVSILRDRFWVVWLATPARDAAPRCGARTRSGQPCRCRVEPGKKRCKLHGGKSTGPRTEEGRRRIAESNQLRAAAKVVPPGAREWK